MGAIISDRDGNTLKVIDYYGVVCGFAKNPTNVKCIVLSLLHIWLKAKFLFFASSNFWLRYVWSFSHSIFLICDKNVHFRIIGDSPNGQAKNISAFVKKANRIQYLRSLSFFETLDFRSKLVAKKNLIIWGYHNFKGEFLKKNSPKNLKCNGGKICPYSPTLPQRPKFEFNFPAIGLKSFWRVS